MIVELAIAYALNTSEPLYVRNNGGRLHQHTLSLTVKEDRKWWYYNVKPFIWGGHGHQVGRVGAETEVGLKKGIFKVGWYHRSQHNTDTQFPADPVFLDAVKLSVRLK